MRLLYMSIFVVLGFWISAYADVTTLREGHEIRGKIIDNDTKHPISYAYVLLFDKEKQKQVNGITTGDDGSFELRDNRAGTYYLEIHFIGYTTKTIPDLVLDESREIVDLGNITIQPDIVTTDEILVEAERSPITYEIDKKVINVDEQITAASGTAVEILENVPSITVDIDGNVSLRGSGSFTVLIDGRPTILDGNEILQQISSSSLKNIEIITNPSAKFNPEGTAGIINLVMKKNKNLGFHGLIEANGGYRNQYGTQLMGDYKTERYQLTLDVGYNQRARYGSDEEENITYQNGLSFYRNSDGESDREGDRMGFRGELAIDLSDADYMSFGGSYRDREWNRFSEESFYEWSDLEPDRTFYSSSSRNTRGGDQYEMYINYDHKFNTEGHIIRTQAEFESGDGLEESRSERFDRNFDITDGTKTTEEGPDKEFQFKVDYTLPFSENSKFEAGYQNELDYSEEVTGYYRYNLATNRYDFFDAYSNNVSYQRNEYALYSLYASELGRLGYQFGFRAEYTDRKIELLETNDNYIIDRWDYFPSVHSSYEFGNGNNVMASYTRRIDRPRGWYLEPFETWYDAYNVRVGNPAVKPEYIDSYEAGYQTTLGQSLFSVETYYRVQHNKIERLRSVYADTTNITLHTTANVGKDYAFGTELMFNFDPLKMWNVNLMGNLYNYRIKGEIFDEPFSRESFNWNLRFNNRFKLGQTTQFQLNASYNSASVSAQTNRDGYFYTHLALRQDFFGKNLSATLQVRDVFGSANYEYTARGVDFYTYRNYNRETPEIMLNLRWNINRRDDRNDRNQSERGGDNFGGGEEF